MSREPSSRPLMAWLWRGYLRRHTGLILLTLAFMALEGATQGALAMMMKPMFDNVFLAGDRSALVWVGFGVMGIFVVRALSGVAQKTMMAYIAQKSAGDMRQ